MEEAHQLQNQHDKQPIPAVSEILDDGTLVELTYDPVRRRTAFAIWRNDRSHIAQSFDRAENQRLIPFSPDNNLIKNEVVLLPSEPLEYGTEQELIADIQSFIHCYVDLSPTFEKIASYYILLSWVYDAFNELPYLRLRGDYGTGKTRALLTIGSLCYKAFFASGASTVSPIFHILDAFRGTLIFDEADFRFSDEKAEIVKILNNGNVRGLPVLRTMITRQREFDPRAFHVFGPKIVATRGSYDDRALESRFITEETGQHRLRGDVPINLPTGFKDEALVLRNKLLLYRFRQRGRARLDPSLVDPALEPRLNQILVPLLSIISDPEIRAELRILAGQLNGEMLAERGESIEGRALGILHELINEYAPRSVPIGGVVVRFQERHGDDYERPMTPKWMGNILRKRLRIVTVKSHGIYVVPSSESSKIAVLWDRYGLTNPSLSSGAMSDEPEPANLPEG